MEIIEVSNKQLKREYLNFIHQVYNNYSNFKDTVTSVVKTFLDQSDSFAKDCLIRPFLIKDNKHIAAECIFIYHQSFQTLQLSFFEALPNQQIAVNMLIDRGKILCQELGLSKLIIGINGHVNYGVGILTNHFDKDVAFDTPFNPPYYQDYFKTIQAKEIGISSFKFDMKNQAARYSPKISERMNKRFTFRYMNISEYEKEITILTNIINEGLKDIPLYFQRTPQENVELMGPLKYFLTNENLIFALKDGKEIGFIFWTPDFNQVVPHGMKFNPLFFYLIHRLHKNRINNYIVNTIGVLPEYHGSGVIMGLFYEMFKCTKDKYFFGESGFVINDNHKSRLISTKMNDELYKQYVVYELDI